MKFPYLCYRNKRGRKGGGGESEILHHPSLMRNYKVQDVFYCGNKGNRKNGAILGGSFPIIIITIIIIMYISHPLT